MYQTTNEASDIQKLTARLRWLYDDYRHALLNRKYYGYRLDFYQKTVSLSDYVVLFASSGTVAGARFWKTQLGTLCWTALGLVVVVVTVARKAGRISKNVERYSNLFAAYSDLFYDLDALVKEVKYERRFSHAMDSRLRNAETRIKQLAVHDDPKPREKLRKKCFKEVNVQIPVDTLWVPAPKGI